MRRLDLDFQRGTAGGRRAGWILLVVAAAFAADVARSWHEAHGKLQQVQQQLASRPEPGAARRIAGLPPPSASAEELAAAQKVLKRMTVPWDGFFASLEHAHSDRVSLLAVEPDAESRSVTITGEARDYLAALSYVATLAEAKGFSRVHLVRHEARAGTPGRSVAFTVSAQWTGVR